MPPIVTRACERRNPKNRETASTCAIVENASLDAPQTDESFARRCDLSGRRIGTLCPITTQ